ncbi:MAG: hypothetical protein ACR2IE_15160 [Candidatus Sumerlaeaceae bacterium]
MIKINLLPPEAGKRPLAAAKRSAGPNATPYYMVLALLYVVAFYGAFWAYQQGEKATKLLAQKTSDRDKRKAEVKRREKRFQENNLLSQEIEEKYAVVQALGPENRIFWSEKMNMVAKARMNLAVYVTKLRLDETILELETPESVKKREEWARQQQKNQAKGTEPKPIKQPVINQTLTIEAIAYGADSSQRLRQVNSFYENLKTLQWKRKSGTPARFLERLRPDLGQLNQRVARVGGVDVLRFGFAIQANPQLTKITTNQGAPGSLLTLPGQVPTTATAAKATPAAAATPSLPREGAK